MPRYEVLTWTLCQGWINCWQETDEAGNEKPCTYATEIEAQEAIDEYLQDIQEQIDSGEREPDNGYDEYDFKIEACKQ